MLQIEKEQLAKEKVLSLIENIPSFTHIFFIENESVAFTTKRNYYIIFFDFLNHVKNIYEITDIKSIPPYVLENLTINDVESYRDILLKKYNESTVNSKISSIKGIFNFLYYNHIIGTNIMSQIINYDIATEKVLIKQSDIDAFFQSISKKKDEFVRKRNLSIASLVIDTGLSVQDIVELNIYNFVGDKIVYQDFNGNIIQYILGQNTIRYLKQYMDMISVEDINSPLYTTIQNDRISSDAVQNIFIRYSDNIKPSDFQAKPTIKIKDSHNYILTITPKDNKIKAP